MGRGGGVVCVPARTEGMNLNFKGENSFHIHSFHITLVPMCNVLGHENDGSEINGMLPKN